MMISLINALGFAVVPASDYQNLVSGNEIKGDRIVELTESTIALRNSNRHIVAQCESTNQSLRDRVRSLEAETKDKANRLAEIESNSDLQKATIQQFREQIEKLESTNRLLDEVLDDIKAENSRLCSEQFEVQKELDVIKEVHRKTLAANAELDLKLSEAIANLSATELQCNEQTVQISALQISRNALLADFDNSKRAVNIELVNHRIAILKAIDNLERSLRAQSV